MTFSAGIALTFLSFFFAYFTFRKYGDTACIGIRLGRVLAAILAGAGIILMLGLVGNRKESHGIVWETNIEQALKKAKKQHRPVVIDAWAQWCPACKELGEKTLTDPKVEKALKKYVRVKFDMTAINKASDRLKKLGYNIKNLPTVLFIHPSGKAWSCRVNNYIKPAGFMRYVRAFERDRRSCPQKNDLMRHGFWIAILIAFAAGLGVSLTPCIFPTLPGVAAILSGRQGFGDDKTFIPTGKRVQRSVLFVLGMVVVYTALGLASGLLGWGFGSMLSNAWVTGAMAVIFGLMGLAYLRLFKTGLPDTMKADSMVKREKRRFCSRFKICNALFLKKLCKHIKNGLEIFGSLYESVQVALSKTRESNPGIMLMGGGIGLVAAPCSGPVTVAILAYIASAGGAVYGSILMFAFALGMGTLFFIMGVFASLADHIPRRRTFGAMVEFTFSVALFASAIYYVLLTI